MKLTPAADDLAEDLAWLVGLIYLFFDDRRHEATTQAVIEDARRQLIAVIGGAA